jgi:hypothetical protein
VAELGSVVLPTSDRLVERDRRTRGAQQELGLVGIDVEVRRGGDLLDRGLAVADRLEAALGAVELLQRLIDVDRDADRRSRT